MILGIRSATPKITFKTGWILILVLVSVAGFLFRRGVGQFWGDLLQVLHDQRLIPIYLRTLRIAGKTAGVTAFFGTILSYFLYESKLPLRRFFYATFFWPLILPPYFLASAWLAWFGDFGVIKFREAGLGNEDGCVFLLSLYLMALVVLTVGNSVRKLTPEQKEAALLCAGPGRYFRRIWLPAAFPGVIGGGLFTFILAANQYSIPSILGINTLSTEIYAEFGAFYDYYRALVKAAPLLGCFFILAVCLGRFWREAGITDYSVKMKYPLTERQWLRLSGLTVWSIYCVGAFLLPLIGVTLRIRSPLNLWKAVTMAGEQIRFSLWFSAFSGIGLTIIGMFLAYFYLRRKTGYILTGLSVFLVLPPVFAAIGLIFLLNRPELEGIYQGGGLLFAGYLVRFLPLAFIFFLPVIHAIPPELEEVSRLCGKSALWIWRNILFPLIFPAFLMIWLVVFFFCYGESEASILLYPPGLETVSIRILSLMHYGASPAVNGLVLSQLIILGLISLLCKILQRKRRKYEYPFAGGE